MANIFICIQYQANLRVGGRVWGEEVVRLAQLKM